MSEEKTPLYKQLSQKRNLVCETNEDFNQVADATYKFNRLAIENFESVADALDRVLKTPSVENFNQAKLILSKL